MISIQTTRRIYEYFQSNKLDPIKTILLLEDSVAGEGNVAGGGSVAVGGNGPACTAKEYRVKCVNGLTYLVTEDGDEIVSVERM